MEIIHGLFYSLLTCLLDHWWSLRKQLCRKPTCSPERRCLGDHTLQPNPTARRNAGAPSKWTEGVRGTLGGWPVFWVAWSHYRFTLILSPTPPGGTLSEFTCASHQAQLGFVVTFMCQVAVMGLCLESCPSFDWGISPSCELAPYREQRHSLPLGAAQGVGRLRSTCQLVVCASVLLGRSTRREVRRGRSQKWSELCPFENIADLLAESHGIQCLSLSQLIWVTTNQHSSWIYLASMGGSAQPVPLIVFQVLQFNTNCPECNAPAQTNMKLVRIF